MYNHIHAQPYKHTHRSSNNYYSSPKIIREADSVAVLTSFDTEQVYSPWSPASTADITTDPAETRIRLVVVTGTTTPPLVLEE